MKIQRDCIICILNQILRVSDYLDLNESQKDIILKKALSRSADYDYKHLTPPEFSEFLYDIVIAETNIYDPYQTLKKSQNDMILTRSETFENKINNSENPLFKAAKYALAGNIIDYGGVQKFDLDLERLDQIKIDIDDFEKFKKKLKTSKSILYIADNAGEAVFDKFFIKQIKRYYKNIKIYYSVKSKPAINDITEEDADYIGIKEFATVIKSGMGMAGTVIPKTTDEFKKIYNSVDIIISKGQGNFETLHDEKQDILFIFKVKCKMVSDFSKIKLNSNIFAFRSSLDLK